MMDWLFFLFIILAISDAITTIAVLDKGGKELNPFLAKFMDLVGEVPALIISRLIVFAGGLYLTMINSPVLAVIVFIFALTVANNIYQARK